MADLPDAMAEFLNEGETSLAWAWVRVERARTARATFLPIHVVVEAYDLIRNVFHMKKLGLQSAAAEFPLSRNMAMCVADHRILVWKTSAHPRRIQSYLGEVSRARIASAHLPYNSYGHWKTLILKTTDGLYVRLKIDAQSAAPFVELLNPVP